MTDATDSANQVQAVKLNRVGDYIRQGTHFAASGAIMIGVGIWVGPWTLLGCAAGAGVLGLVQAKFSDKLMPSILLKREVKPDDAEGLSDAVDHFTKKAGLAEKPELYDFQVDPEALKKKNDDITTPAQLARILNAAAMGLKKFSVIISQPLLKVLRPSETHAIIGHEFAHLGAGHTKSMLVAGWMQTTTMFAAMFGFGAAVLAEGIVVGLLSMAGAIAIAIAGYRMMPKKEERYARDGTIRPEARRLQLGILAAQETLSVGLLALPNPKGVLTAFLIEHLFFWSANLVNKSLLRRNEFHADRAAVAMGADPLALILSLRKIEKSLELNEPSIASATNWRKGPLHLRLLRMALSTLKTHPDTLRRCKRLARIARKQGRDAKEIEQALTGSFNEELLRLPPRDAVLPEKGGLSEEFDKSKLTLVWDPKWSPEQKKDAALRILKKHSGATTSEQRPDLHHQDRAADKPAP